MNNWMAIPLYYSRHLGGTLVFECDYDISMLDISGLSFYYEVLVAWSTGSNFKTTDINLALEQKACNNSQQIGLLPRLAFGQHKKNQTLVN